VFASSIKQRIMDAGKGKTGFFDSSGMGIDNVKTLFSNKSIDYSIHLFFLFYTLFHIAKPFAYSQFERLDSFKCEIFFLLSLSFFFF
jgi:hypothetical protein